MGFYQPTSSTITLYQHNKCLMRHFSGFSEIRKKNLKKICKKVLTCARSCANICSNEAQEVAPHKPKGANDMRYFTNCKCIEDVKEQYHKLIKKYHPDVNQEDTTEAMKQINDEYKQLHKKFKNIHRAENGGTYEAKQQTTETPEEFIEALSKIIHLDGLEIEICGRWVWVSGNTYTHKDQLKTAGYKFASKKKMWYWHPADAECRGNGKTTIEDIRNKYGSQSVTTEKLYALA